MNRSRSVDWTNLRSIAREELGPLQPRWLIVLALSSLLPCYALNRIRTRLIQAAGFTIGPDVAFFGTPRIYGAGNIQDRLRIGPGCHINTGVHFDLSGIIEFERHSGVGHDVMFLTNSHEIGDDHQRAGQTVILPIFVGAGAWIGARSTILPGVRIGEGAVVAAGSMVTKDVAAHTMVAGVPATVRRTV